MDEVELERVYNLGLESEKSGDIDAAEKAYRQVLEIDPDDHGGVSVRLAAMKRGQTPSTAPKAYVATLFDQTADMFDYILVNQLGYDVPSQLRAALMHVAPHRIFSRLLDLGCGTGLSAEALDDLARHKTGVDIAEKMVEIAFSKGDYDKLYVADALNFIFSTDETWDLVVATDVLPYMGELDVFFKGVTKKMGSRGLFCFSSETLESHQFNGAPYCVGQHQRFAHHSDYIIDLLSANQLEVVSLQDIVVRQEQTEAVRGQLFIACAQE